jgi:hypothetical protein
MISKNKHERGDLANRKSSENDKLELGNNFTLTYVIYQDHVEFKNCNSITMRPCVRETIGWISSENSEAVYICSDRPAKPFKNLKTRESGLLILKCDILEMINITFDNCFICNREFILGKTNS